MWKNTYKSWEAQVLHPKNEIKEKITLKHLCFQQDRIQFNSEEPGT